MLKLLFLCFFLGLQVSYLGAVGNLSADTDDEKSSAGGSYSEEFVIHEEAVLTACPYEKAYSIHRSIGLSHEEKFRQLQQVFGNKIQLIHFVVSTSDLLLVEAMRADSTWSDVDTITLIEEIWKVFTKESFYNNDEIGIEKRARFQEILKRACTDEQVSFFQFARLLGDDGRGKLSPRNIAEVGKLFDVFHKAGRATFPEIIIALSRNFCGASAGKIAKVLVPHKKNVYTYIGSGNIDTLLQDVLQGVSELPFCRDYYFPLQLMHYIRIVSLQTILRIVHSSTVLDNQQKQYIMARVFQSEYYKNSIARLKDCLTLLLSIEKKYFTPKNVPLPLRLNIDKQRLN